MKLVNSHYINIPPN